MFPSMGTRDRWLDEGIALLRAGGIGTVRTDRLATRLGLTKGSFHHHFAGMTDYRRALLRRCRERNSEAVESVRASGAGLEPSAAIAALPGLAGGMLDVPLDAALRGWAVEDAAAHATVQAIDAERLDLLTELWSRVLTDPAAARTAALVPHLIAVGASVSSDFSERDLQRVYELLAKLAPAVDSQ
jgi:AcrR family transcriptional regulator